MPFVCSICEEESTRICVRCTKDACDNHLCEKCLRCSDCCECEVTLADQAPSVVRPPALEPHPEPEVVAAPPPAESTLPAEPLPSEPAPEPGDQVL